MKFSLSLLAFAVIASSFSACTTLPNRRDLYRPADASGTYTKRYSSDRYNEGIFGVSQPDYYPAGPNEGIFGISNSEGRYYTSSGGTPGGLFGVSRNRH